MEKVGEITAVHGDQLEISFCRPQDCGHCHACEGGQQPTVIRVAGSGRVGDYAAVELPTGTVVKASLLAYALPVAGLMLGMVLGQALSGGALAGTAVGGGTGLLVAVGAVAVTEKGRRRSDRWQPKLTRIFPREDHEEKGEENHDHSADE